MEIEYENWSTARRYSSGEKVLGIGRNNDQHYWRKGTALFTWSGDSCIRVYAYPHVICQV